MDLTRKASSSSGDKKHPADCEAVLLDAFWFLLIYRKVLTGMSSDRRKNAFFVLPFKKRRMVTWLLPDMRVSGRLAEQNVQS